MSSALDDFMLAVEVGLFAYYVMTGRPVSAALMVFIATLNLTMRVRRD